MYFAHTTLARASRWAFVYAFSTFVESVCCGVVGEYLLSCGMVICDEFAVSVLQFESGCVFVAM